MYVLFETFHLEIILGHLGQMLLYSFKKFLHSFMRLHPVLENLILQLFQSQKYYSRH